MQRIEVLKDGASSVHGSDAVAGVVNIILYKEFKGTVVSAQLGSSTEGAGQLERSASLQTGFGSLDEKGWSVVFSLDALKRRQAAADRRVLTCAAADFRGYANGTLAWTPTNYYGTSDPTRRLGGVQEPAAGARTTATSRLARLARYRLMTLRIPHPDSGRGARAHLAARYPET